MQNLSTSFVTLKSYILHIQLHHKIKSTFSYPHGFPNCSRRFTKVTSLKSHMSRDHNKFSSYGFLSLSYQCSLNACKKCCASKNKVIKHLQDHIRKMKLLLSHWKNIICNFIADQHFPPI